MWGWTGGKVDMAGVRKASSTDAPRGVVYDFSRARTAPVAPARADSGDSSGITPEARELAAALGLVDEAAEIRAEKVRALKEQIASGTYNPDPREIAKKMVEQGF